MSIGRIQEFLWIEDLNTENVNFVKEAGKMSTRILDFHILAVVTNKIPETNIFLTFLTVQLTPYF